MNTHDPLPGAPVPSTDPGAGPRGRRAIERLRRQADRLLDDLTRLEDAGGHALRGPRLTVMAIAALLLAFLLWAAWFRLDELVRAEGRLVPPQRVMTVQSAEGGVVAAVRVADGDRVRAGQLLLVLDDRQALADLAEAEQPHLAALAAQARLDADLHDRPVRFPPELDRHADIRQGALRASAADRAALAAAQSAIEHRAAQRRAQLQGTRAEWRQRTAEQRLLDEELAVLQPLVPAVVSRTEWLARERERIALRVAIDALERQMAEHQAALRELQAEQDHARAEQHARWARDAAEQAVQVAIHRSRAEARRAQVGRTTVLAPVDGVVKQLHARSSGQVVPPATGLLELVPDSAQLQVEARIDPRDAGFVVVGQAVRVKVGSYDFAVHGAMDGVVQSISADTLTDRDQPHAPPFYRLTVAIDKPLRDRQGHPLPLTPGMTVSLDIVTGQRSVLTYLMKPLVRGMDQALGER